MISKDQSAASPRASFERRATVRVLLFTASVALVTSILAAVGRTPSLHEHFVMLAQFSRVRLLPNAFSALALFTLAKLYGRGANWPVTVVVLGVTVVLVPGMRR